jgi:hypothetical protein
MVKEVNEVPEEEVPVIKEEGVEPIEGELKDVVQEVVEDIQKEELESQTVFVSVKEMIQLYEKQVESICVPFVEQSVMIEPQYNLDVNNYDDTLKVVEAIEPITETVKEVVDDVPVARFQNIRRFLPKSGFF